MKNPYLKSMLYEIGNRDLFQDVFQHDKMIADRVRLDAYHEALRRQIRPDDVVLDLGTGTGILAFFAHRQNPRRIYAVDHGNIIHYARRLARANGIEGIKFVNTHSRQFDPGEKLDLIVHEQLGEKLFDERVIENICDVRDRLLKPDGRILPARFEFFLEPFQLNEDCQVPFLWENSDVHGISYAALAEVRDEIAGSGESRYRWRVLPQDCGHFLCEPASVFDLDLLTVKQDALPKVLRFDKTAARGGTMHGFCVFFRIVFDETLELDTSPFSARTNWMPYLYRHEAFGVRKGDVLRTTWDIGALSDPDGWTLTVERA